MTQSEKLLAFFHGEIEAEERAGFPRLSRIPDTRVMERLDFYKSLSESDRRDFRDCCAHWAQACYGFVIGISPVDRTQHPFFEKWQGTGRSWLAPHSVPHLRAMVQQYKIDAYRGVRSTVSKDEFEHACSIRSVKAPELRKRVRAALRPLGYRNRDDIGNYHCNLNGQNFAVSVDYGGRSAQLRYWVSRPEFQDEYHLSRFCFEKVLGFGFGDWNYIVEENVDESLSVFADVVSYCIALPERIRAAVGV